MSVALTPRTAEIEDTFAEAFKMVGARVIITARTIEWANEAASRMTGFATSIIGCGVEAGIEGPADDTPDGRPGISVLLFAVSTKQMAKQLVNRIGQCVMTSPTSACFNGLASGERVIVGGQLRYFGDGFQASKSLDGRRYWRVPVMEGEFVVEHAFRVQESVGGGNFFIMGRTLDATLAAAEAAVAAMRPVRGAIMPFPGGIVRSGSKPGSAYKFLMASTNTTYCPTLRGIVQSALPADVNCVEEIVIDGLDVDAVREAMRLGIAAASRQPGIVKISAGNYGGTLGQYQIPLRELLEAPVHG